MHGAEIFHTCSHMVMSDEQTVHHACSVLRVPSNACVAWATSSEVFLFHFLILVGLLSLEKDDLQRGQQFASYSCSVAGAVDATNCTPPKNRRYLEDIHFDMNTGDGICTWGIFMYVLEVFEG